MADLFEGFADAVIEGNARGIAALVQQALDAGTPAQEILERGLLPGMDVVGQEFKAGRMFIPEVLLSAKTMSAAMEVLRPRLTQSASAGRGTVVIGTVQGDLHSIGKSLVAMLLEGAGYQVVDLGIDVKAEDFVAAAIRHKPQVLGMSALLTTTMLRMAETIQALQEAGIRDQMRVIVGGAPISEEFAQRIGADGYAPNAAAAVDLVRAMPGAGRKEGGQ